MGMVSQKAKTRKFNGMSYREVQSANSKNRNKIDREYQKWLKDNNYKNIGWDNIIHLSKKLAEFDLTLEELFLEADSVGNKYLTDRELENFNQKLSKEVNNIAEEIDKMFPASEIEVIDFSKKTNNRSRKKHNYQFS